MSEKFFFYRDKYDLVKININEILLLKASKNYVYFISASKVIFIRTTLEAAVEQLSSLHFVKINRTIAICLRFVDGIKRDSLFLKCPGLILPTLKKLDMLEEPDEDAPSEMIVEIDDEIKKSANGEDSRIDKDCLIEFTIIKSCYPSFIQRITIIGNVVKEGNSSSEVTEDVKKK
jgi:hypothetical protein